MKFGCPEAVEEERAEAVSSARAVVEASPNRISKTAAYNSKSVQISLTYGPIPPNTSLIRLSRSNAHLATSAGYCYDPRMPSVHPIAADRFFASIPLRVKESGLSVPNVGIFCVTTTTTTVAT